MGVWVSSTLCIWILTSTSTLTGIGKTEPAGRNGGECLARPAPLRVISATKLDFTQNLEEATDAITLGRRHPWLESEGFSLSAANADVQELPATLYH